MAQARLFLTSLLTLLALPGSAIAQTTTFSYTGNEQTYTVPAGVSSVVVTATGGAGAGAGYFPGGRGAVAVGTLHVSRGQILYIEVGGNGSGPSGGFNGGGAGGVFNTLSVFGGGGASDVRTVARSQGGSLASRLIVAGGGGGSAYPAAGPGDAGFPGGASPGAPANAGGGAGTSSAGGAGGCTPLGVGCGTTGTLGQGGAGGASAGGQPGQPYPSEGGGGGGGLYGGGGGAGADGIGGGGGGSSLVPTSGSLTLAARGQAPAIVIATYPAPTRYISIGDSVAAGVGATDSHGWSALLFDNFLSTPRGGKIDTAAYDGVPGETSGSLIASGRQLDTALAQIADSGTNTKFVSLQIGANDALANPDCASGLNVSPCPFAANFATALDRLNAALAQDPGDEIVEVVAYYNPAVGTPAEAFFDVVLLGTDDKVDCSGTGAQLGLQDLITCIGTAKGAVVADPYPAFEIGGQSFIWDGLHPNDAGHAAIATVAQAAILAAR